MNRVKYQPIVTENQLKTADNLTLQWKGSDKSIFVYFPMAQSKVYT